MDYFDKTGDNAIINDQKDTIEHSTNRKSNSCYGVMLIPSIVQCIYEWKFKINKKCTTYGPGGICIGVDEYKTKWINNWFYGQQDTINYSYHSNGKKYNSGKYALYGPTYAEGDVITMKLDFSSPSTSIGIISFNKNNDINFKDNAYINIVRHKDIKYKLAVYTKYKDDSVTLLSYSCNDNNDNNSNDNDNDVKQNVNDQMKSLHQEIANLKKSNIRLTQQSTEYQNEIQMLKIEKQEMKLMINDLNDEIKVLKQQLKNKQPLDYNNWRKWDSNDVFRFIMDIYSDGTLNDYKDNIRKEIFESEWNGEALEIIEIGDVKAMGIKNIMIRKHVFKSIKKLTQNNGNNGNNDNGKNDHIEGLDIIDGTSYIK